MSSPAKLKSSEKYSHDHAEGYFLLHHAGLAHRMSQLRDEYMVRKALKLAGDPGLVLDLPCSTGRFWSLLAEKKSRIIIGADSSADMLATAFTRQDTDIVKRVKPLQTSVLNISLPNNSVDTIFSMHLLHQVEEAEHRMTILGEFYRVTRETVILSLWVDGNYTSWRRKRQAITRLAHREHEENEIQFVISRAAAEAEFIAAGFVIEQRIDFMPFYAMGRVYVLRKLT